MNHRDTEAQRNFPGSLNEISGVIVSAAFSIHSQLGPGLLESVYEKCLTHALRRRGRVVQCQMSVPIEFEGLRLPSGLRLDMLVDEAVIVEVKAIEAVLPVHKAQILTYLKLSGCRLGLLINFNVPVIRSGITRVAL
jgi:GxxExxY protein